VKAWGTKNRQCGPVSRRGGLPQGSSFRQCRQYPRGGPALKGRSKRPPGWPSTRGRTEPKPLHRHENPPVRGRILMGMPPTEFEFSPPSTAPPGTLGTENPAEKDPGMAEHEGGTEPKPLHCHENPAVRGRISTRTPPTEFEFSPPSTALPWTLGTENPVEKDPGMAEHEGGTEPKPLHRHENPAVRGRTSTGTAPTEFEFSPASTAPPGTLGTETPTEEDPGMAEHEGGNRAKTAAPPRKPGSAGLHLDASSTTQGCCCPAPKRGFCWNCSGGDTGPRAGKAAVSATGFRP
jgi:hypothetical protein